MDKTRHKDVGFRGLLSAERSAEALVSEPTNREAARAFLNAIRDDEGVFSAQEDTLFDYKIEFPHSISDDYFTGICRLAFAFYNSFGGIIVIGVRDEDRTSGHNKKTINIERLNTRIRELAGQTFNIQHVPFKDDGVDFLVVPKRAANRAPAVLLKEIGKYEEGTVWLRRGHEVLEAVSRDVSFLFGPRINQDEAERIPSYIPPSSSTIGKFVGRVDVLSALIDWIAQKDEPRAFLWGRGGSGKSTIAHEFCQIIRDYGRYIRTVDGSPFDRVVFLSAKERELNTGAGNIEQTMSVDFRTYRELLSALLIACDYSATEDFSSLSPDELETRVTDVFNHENIFLVLDDIDTLTTRGEEAGFNALYKMAIRAKRTIRILYTQRNLPGSAENAIRVPGFTRDREYYEFVESCCSQFDVPLPEPSYLEGQLKEATECIPLILETIVRLRRICGTYGKAHSIFMERRGDEARRYLFEREYEVLPKNNNARHVLAALAEFGTPTGNAELNAALRIGDSAIAESVGEVLGFFLSTITSDEGETRYFLNPVTKAFVRHKTSDLEFGENIVERVRAFKSSGQKKPKEVIIIEAEVNRLLARGSVAEAKEILERSYLPKVTENPAFRMMRAIVYSKLTVPLLSEARDDFNYCVDQGYEDADGMRVWLNLERRVGHSYPGQVKVADQVINGRSYADRVRYEFVARKAVATFFRARDTSESDAFNLFVDALVGHDRAYRYFLGAGLDTNWNFKNVRNTGLSAVACARQLSLDKEIIKVFRDVHRAEGCLSEPLLDPLFEAGRYLAAQRTGEVGKRRDNLLRGLLRDLRSGALRFDSVEMTTRCAARLETLVERAVARPQ